MAGKVSAGLLLYRRAPAGPQVLLVHMGGPFWQRKDAGAWSIPKGEHEPDEDALVAARREFEEETGFQAPAGAALDLGTQRQAGGKLVHAWALEADGEVDLERLSSNTFELEWPPRSGKVQEFPEVDRAAWLGLEQARAKLVRGQVPFLAQLARHLGEPAPEGW